MRLILHLTIKPNLRQHDTLHCFTLLKNFFKIFQTIIQKRLRTPPLCP